MTRLFESTGVCVMVASLVAVVAACGSTYSTKRTSSTEREASSVKIDSLGSVLSEPLAVYPIPLDRASLLTYLAQRLLDSPGALNNRVSAADEILVGTVERSEFVENTSVTSAPKHLVTIARVRVQERLKGPAGNSPTKLVWIDDGTMGGAYSGIIAGKAGVLFLGKPTPKDLADAYPDARAPDDTSGPPLRPDANGKIAKAIKWWMRVSSLKPADQVMESGAVLSQPFGPEQQMAYAMLARAGTAAHHVLATALGKGKESPHSLLRRVVLARIGDTKLAEQGLDPDQLDETTLQWFGLTPVVEQGRRVSLLGPPPEVLIPDEAAPSATAN
jgi:hypothetical protein